MVKLKLLIKATLENVTSLRPKEPESFTWFFGVTCNSCHEPHPKPIAIARNEERPLTGSRGTANFVWKCGFCKRESSATFDSSLPPTASYSFESSEGQKFSPLLVVECRGCEFTSFVPKGTWLCEGNESGTKFEFEIEEDEGDWTDYDEKAGNPVSVMEIESKWERA
ncbi:DUF866-domain-containing protein [Atractiella rhizophila]|nr:DUF866-domain-containing protein [Atractiella rhizophila]